jgi:hypothetical protein
MPRPTQTPFYSRSGAKLATQDLTDTDLVIVQIEPTRGFWIKLSSIEPNGALVGKVDRVNSPLPLEGLSGIKKGDVVVIEHERYIWGVNRSR